MNLRCEVCGKLALGWRPCPSNAHILCKEHKDLWAKKIVTVVEADRGRSNPKKGFSGIFRTGNVEHVEVGIIEEVLDAAGVYAYNPICPALFAEEKVFAAIKKAHAELLCLPEA